MSSNRKVHALVDNEHNKKVASYLTPSLLPQNKPLTSPHNLCFKGNVIVPKVGPKTQMEDVQLILMNVALQLAKVLQIGALLIHLSGALIHLVVLGVVHVLRDTQV